MTYINIGNGKEIVGSPFLPAFYIGENHNQKIADIVLNIVSDDSDFNNGDVVVCLNIFNRQKNDVFTHLCNVTYARVILIHSSHIWAGHPEFLLITSLAIYTGRLDVDLDGTISVTDTLKVNTTSVNP